MAFELWLFSTDPDYLTRAIAAGVDGLVVDWERRGKDSRQASADTQIGTDTLADLRCVRAVTDAPILCRINSLAETTADEVEAAIDGGATEILLPMVRCTDDVDAVVSQVAGRCGVSVLIETDAAVAEATAICKRPLSHVYVGLNDLAIDRGSPTIFEAIADGTVARVRGVCPRTFGFGGLTLPDGGSPIPCRLLMGEMARVGAEFAFLRRSFLRDVPIGALSASVRRIREGLDRAFQRAPSAVAYDHDRFCAAVRRERTGDATR